MTEATPATVTTIAAPRARGLTRVVTAARRPVDIASLAAFRAVFGLVMFAGLVRFLASGWIQPMYGDPSFFFTYPGFDWVRPWSVTGMYVHYAVLAALALAIAVGAWTRTSAALFTLGFAYTQLIDVTNYLNHHYLVVMLGALLAVLPSGRALSVDAWRQPAARLDEIPAWMVWAIRLQVACVYVYAGLAKVQADWLLHAQPLNIWLSARTDTPLVGPWLDERWVAFAASWAGCLYDLTIVGWLSWARTRRFALVAVVGFHAITGYFFNIGMFPLIMTTAVAIYFPPSWPRRWLARWSRRSTTSARAPAPRRAEPSRLLIGALALHLAVQVALPLRHWLYPGTLAWNEDGMRFAWQVMVREKHGAITYVVRFPDGRRLEVPPRRYLTARQEREMAGQPDLVAQLARRIAADFDRAGHGPVAVHVESAVSLNGRPPAPMIDPAVDLARVADLGPRTWVLPAPTSAPIHLRALR